MPFPDLQVQAGSGLTFPWVEFVSRRGSTSDMSAGNDSSGCRAGTSIIIEFSDLERAMQQLLGYPYRYTRTNTVTGATNATPISITTASPHGFSTGNRIRISGVTGNTAANGSFLITVTGGSTFTLDGSTGNAAYVSGGDVTLAWLSRFLPWAHPRFTQLWCTRIASARGMKAVGKRIIYTSPLAETQYILLSLEFTRPPYAILSDADIIDPLTNERQEWLRFTDRFWKNQTEILSRDGFNYVYAEGAANNPNGLYVNGQSVGVRLGTASLTRTWYQLPQDAVYNENGFPAGVFVDGNGSPLSATCNETEFFGMHSETMLYQSAEVTPVPPPIPVSLMGLPGLGELYPTLFNITFHFDYFNPGPVYGNNRGWNLLPWVDGIWYKATTAVGGRRLIDTNDLYQLWHIL